MNDNKTNIDNKELSFEEFKIIPARDNDGLEIKPFQPSLPPGISPFIPGRSSRFRIIL